MSQSVVACVSVCMLALNLPAQGESESAGSVEQKERATGTLKLQFEETHPLGSFAEVTKRMRWTRGTIAKHDPKPGYQIAKESFFVHVPENYDDKAGFGLLVWISPSDQGNCGVDWPAALQQHKLIHIGPDKAGNNRFVWYRIALALDAVRNMSKRYAIDADRIYIGGHSGGGRLASTAAMLWPDVFHGGIYCCGANHFRKIKKPKQDFYWPAKFKKPTGRLLGLAQRKSRHVFINGAKDFNIVHSRAVFRDLKTRDRFKRLTFLEMAGKGHHMPDAEWLSRCFAALDGPLFAERKKAAEKAKARKKSVEKRR